MRNLRSARSLAILAPLGIALASCGGSSGGGGSSTPSADVFVTDATVDDLLGFQIEIASLRLRRTDTTLTGSLLAGPVRVDFRALEDRLRWMVSGELPAGTYDAARIDFTPGSAVAVAEDGSPVAVNATSDQWIASFAPPVSASGYRRIELDLQLDDSLSGDVSSGTIDFTPVGAARSSNGSSSGTIDEVKGTLLSVDAAADRLVIDALVDDDPSVALGELDVSVGSTTLLLMEDGGAFASRAAFYASLVAGVTLLEVHGRVGAGGLIAAERIEIEDALGGGGLAVVEIEGLVGSIDLGNGFDLLIREVEKGESIAGPILAGLGNPGTIAISYDSATVFVLHDDGSGDQLTTDASLAVGQRVDVKFITFASEPFPAFKVEIKDERADIEGVVTDTSGLPASFVMHIDDDEPVLVSGAVLSDSTDVVVDVSQSAFRLEVDGKPSLSASELQVGLEIEVRGVLSGVPATPAIAATLVKVKPGELDDAAVTAVDTSAGSFTTSGGDLDDPFGAGISAGPLTFVVAPGASFDGDASSLAELATLFANLGLGETLAIEVEGLATGQPNEVQAWEIDAKVEN